MGRSSSQLAVFRAVVATMVLTSVLKADGVGALMLMVPTVLASLFS